MEYLVKVRVTVVVNAYVTADDPEDAQDAAQSLTVDELLDGIEEIEDVTVLEVDGESLDEDYVSSEFEAAEEIIGE